MPAVGNITLTDNVCYGAYRGVLSNETLTYGVADADLVILVSAEDTLRDPGGRRVPVCAPRVLSLATHCVLDQWDRPVVGFVNFCLPLFTLGEPKNTTSSDQQAGNGTGGDTGGQDGNDGQVLPASGSAESSPIVANFYKAVERDDFHETRVEDTITVAIHELAHILGMDSHLFKFFRDGTTGEPLTRRPFTRRTVRCVDGISRLMFFASDKVLQWNSTSEGMYYFDMVTPHVAAVARNQFDCPLLKGARLENQRVRGNCVGTHWDERLFLTELMGQVYSGEVDVLSPLTLAFMEDTGWYQVNYRNVTLSPFGRGLGCDFVNQPCIVNDTVPSYADHAFCDKPITFVGETISDQTLNSLTCDPSHTAFTFCDLFDARQVPTDFVTLPDNPFHYFTDPNLVPSFIQADYCPLPIKDFGVDCTHSLDYIPIYEGETIGRNSKCVDAFRLNDTDVPIDSTTMNNTAVSTRTNHPACVTTICDETLRKVVVRISGHDIVCQQDGEILPMGPSSSSYFECPKVAIVCTDLFCPSSCSGRGTCLWNETVPRCACFDPDDISDGCYGEYAPSQQPSVAPTFVPSNAPTPLPTIGSSGQSSIPSPVHFPTRPLAPIATPPVAPPVSGSTRLGWDPVVHIVAGLCLCLVFMQWP